MFHGLGLDSVVATSLLRKETAVPAPAARSSACDCHAPEEDATTFWRDAWGVPREPCPACAEGGHTAGEG